MFKHPIARDVAWMLALKVVALALIYVCFFSPAARPAIDVDARLLGVSAGGR